MNGYFILAATLGLPLVLGLLCRVGAPHLFFAVMAGELLARYFGHDLGAVTQPGLPQDWQATYGELALSTVPMLMTAAFLRNTTSKSKIILHIVPLAITGLVFAAFVLPLLPEMFKSEVAATEAGKAVLNLNRVIIGGVVVAQLVALWLLNRKSGGHGKKHKD